VPGQDGRVREQPAQGHRRRARRRRPRPPARGPALPHARGQPRAGGGGPGRAPPGPKVLPRRLRPEGRPVLRPDRLRARGGRGAETIPPGHAREDRHQDALRRHGPDGDLLGARQARLLAHRDGARGRGDLSAGRRRVRRRVNPERRSSMPYETMTLEREEAFAVVTLNRPPANAISETLMKRRNAVLAEPESDAAVQCLIITGAGDRIFCAGADLGSAFSGPDVTSFIRFGNSVLRRIERFPKPVIAAINGHALGGGCEISMACHIRILKETARMGQTESNLGIIPGYGGTQRFPRLIGRGRALEHLILGTQIPAQECYRIGLANRLSKEGETLEDAKALAREIVKRPPIASR